MSLELLVFILCVMSFRVVYECIRYKYGARIKARIAHRLDVIEAERNYERIQIENKLKLLEASKVIECEVEVLEEYRPAWNVRYNERQTDYETKLIK